MKMRKSNLDERQEQMMLKIEHNGFWIAFWMLAAFMLIEEAVSGADIKVFGGECIILLTISCYVSIACIRAGIWDRKLQPKFTTNLIASVIAGIVVGLVTFFAIHRYFGDNIGGCIAAACLAGIVTCVLCIIALSISAASYKKREAKLNEEPEEELEEI